MRTALAVILLAAACGIGSSAPAVSEVPQVPGERISLRQAGAGRTDFLAAGGETEIPLHEEGLRFDRCAQEVVTLALDGRLDILSVPDGEHFRLSFRYRERARAVAPTGAASAAAYDERRAGSWAPGESLALDWPVDLQFTGKGAAPERTYRELIRVTIAADGKASAARSVPGDFICR